MTAQGQTIRIEWPGLPPREFSRNSRVHWRELHNVQGEVNDQVMVLLLEDDQIPVKPWRRAKVTVTFYLPDKRVRDGDNLITSTKPLIDALVAVGVIKDDDLTCIGIPEYRHEYRPGKPGTLIEVAERG